MDSRQFFSSVILPRNPRVKYTDLWRSVFPPNGFWPENDQPNGALVFTIFVPVTFFVWALQPSWRRAPTPTGYLLYVFLPILVAACQAFSLVSHSDFLLSTAAVYRLCCLSFSCSCKQGFILVIGESCKLMIIVDIWRGSICLFVCLSATLFDHLQIALWFLLM